MSLRRVYTFETPLLPEPRLMGVKAAAAYEAQFFPLSITSVDLAVLLALASLERGTATSLGSLLQVDRPTVAKSLRCLCGSGAAKAATGLFHRKEAAFEMTPSGRVLMQ